MDRIFITGSMLEDFAAGKIGWCDIAHSIRQFDKDDIVCEDYYRFSLDDMRDVLIRCKADNAATAEFYFDWWEPFLSYLYHNLCVNDLFGEDPSSIRSMRLKDVPLTDIDLLMWIIRHIYTSYDEYNPFNPVSSLDELIDIDSILTMIDWHYEDSSLPFYRRRFIDRIKTDFIIEYDNDLILQDSDRDIRYMFKRFTDEMAAKDDMTALRIKGYACYGGNSIYECDYAQAAECMEKLWRYGGFGYAANTLGYIYYYGMIDNGNPDYEKAFHYYSIGSVYGITESTMKLTDMFRKGLFVKKNLFQARVMLIKLYGELRYRFESGEIECEFPEVARRMALCWLEDSPSALREADRKEAYRFLLQAQYALNMRNNGTLTAGDEEELAKIKKITDTLKDVYEKRKTTYRTDIPSELYEFVSGHYPCIYKLDIKDLKNDRVKLTITRLPSKNDDQPYLSLLAFPVFDTCVLTDRLSVIAEGTDILELGFCDRDALFFDTVEPDHSDNLINKLMFSFKGEPIAVIHARFYRFRNPGK